jgi:peptidoglycan-associated lipoprotein
MRISLSKIPLFSVLAITMILAGCSKKVAKVTPPSPPPASPAPTASLAASPDVIHPGQSATLTWQTQNANDVIIEGVGPVNPSGTHTVSPNASTTYTLIAKGPGGTKDASARITVNVPPVQSTATPGPSEADLFAKNVKDVFFDFDKANIRPTEVSSASADASFLEQHRSIRVTIEGHCDDRGSEEYNIALGQSRANSLKEDLLRSGVDAARIQTISYGKERPFCTAEDEACWQENRRDHIVPQQ